MGMQLFAKSTIHYLIRKENEGFKNN